ncbi:hypothetical protein F5Y18DRAFT_435392 [Xylariaceae sp. FL1019]|nr:hypothetical protein F5Y18DRAFT_435392 [Xylariaceae sp. FL1019]
MASNGLRMVNVKCRQCNRNLGTALNRCTQVGSRDISPAMFTPALHQMADVQYGYKYTILESCQYQSVSCLDCGSPVGLRCTLTPVNHVLHSDQWLLVSTAVHFREALSGAALEPTIDRVLEWKRALDSASNGPSTKDLLLSFGKQVIKLETEIQKQKDEIQQLTEAQKSFLEATRKQFHKSKETNDERHRTLASTLNSTQLDLRRQLEDVDTNAKTTLSNSIAHGQALIALKSDVEQIKQRLHSLSTRSPTTSCVTSPELQEALKALRYGRYRARRASRTNSGLIEKRQANRPLSNKQSKE